MNWYPSLRQTICSRTERTADILAKPRLLAELQGPMSWRHD